MKATTTWRCEPMGSVRQTAGRTLLAVKSSKGKGTRTTLPLVMKWFAVGSSVNVLRRVFQKIKSRTRGGRFRPGILLDISYLGHQDDYPDAPGSGNGQR